MIKTTDQDYQKLFQVIAEDAMMGFLTFDGETKQCIYANKLGRQLMEFADIEGPVHLKLDEMFPKSDEKKPMRNEYRSFSNDLLQHEGLYQGILIQKANKTKFVASLGVKKVMMNEKEHILLMLQDITIQMKLQREVTSKQTEIKAAYEELVHQNEQLKQLDKAKDKFIALTTHELRTPASAMVASADVLVNKLYDTKEEQDEFIRMVYDQGMQLLELINDVLDFSKIQAGKMDYFIELNDLVPIIKEEVEAQQSVAEAEKIKIEVELLVEIQKAYFDDLRLKQVIRNILSNAIKYNNPGGKVQIWLETDPANKVLKLFVKDSGKGIPTEELSKVFDEFETLGKVALHHKGTGLGMPISRQMMKSMGGTICVESVINKGSIFWLEIPLEKVLDESVYRKRPSQFDDLAAI